MADSQSALLLADSLGAQRLNISSLPLSFHTSQWLTSIQDKPPGESDKDGSVFQKVLSAKDPEEFSKNFDMCLKQMRGEEDLTGQPNLQVCVSLTERLLREDGYWPKKEIAKLLQLHLVPYSLLPSLCSSMLQHSEDSEELIEYLVRNCEHLPEDCLAKLFQHFTKCNTIDLPLIRTLVSKKFNDVLLTQALKLLSLEEALEILKCLSQLLGNSSCLSKDPPFLLLIDWICVLIDAHFTELIVCAEAEHILLKLRKIAANWMYIFEKLSILDECINQIKNRNQDGTEIESLYFIETICLPL